LPVLPLRADPSAVGRAESATFHNWTVPSSPTVARAGLSGAEDQGVEAGRIGQELPEEGGVSRVGEVPELGRAIQAAAGQDTSLRTVCHREHDTGGAGQRGLERGGAGRVGKVRELDRAAVAVGQGSVRPGDHCPACRSDR
jgi:hypothetical protein